MTAGDIYTVAGSATGAGGESGDGGPATARAAQPRQGIAVDPSGDLYITDRPAATGLREVVSPRHRRSPSTPPPAAPSTATDPGGITITQPDGSQVTFYPRSAAAASPPTWRPRPASTAPCR